jgi:hypothetical protein
MKKTYVFLAVIAVLGTAGCNSGDVPTESYNVDTTPPRMGTPVNAEATSMKESIQSNPNMPDSAKKALLGGK